MAAEASVVQLQRQAALDLWLVTFVEGPDQLIVAASGPWAQEAPPGTVVPWAQSFCIQMVSGRGPAVAPRVHEVPAYAAAAAANDRAPHVGAYVGVPLLRTGDELVGTLCGFAGEPQADAMAECLPLVQFAGRLLGTIWTREVEVAQREEQVTAVRDLAERDLLTGLRNRRGWVTALAHETQRCRRYGLPASVLVVDVQGVDGSARAGGGRDIGDQEARDALLRRTAEVLTQASRPVDIAARPGRTEFLVLAIQCDARATKALDKRIRLSLRSAGVAASVGSATRRLGEDLTETWQRAAEGMGVDQRRRRRLDRARALRAEPHA
jgi:diguanylate cyclase (GGDEF)-like protein